jgi:hypothetical protein
LRIYYLHFYSKREFDLNSMSNTVFHDVLTFFVGIVKKCFSKCRKNYAQYFLGMILVFRLCFEVAD